LSFAFYSHHNWETTRLRDNWQMFTRVYFVLKTALPLFPDLETLLGAKNDKSKFDFANSLSFAFYSRHNWQNNKIWRQLTNKCSRFCTETALPLFQTYENTVGQNDKRKAKLTFLLSFAFYSIQLKTTLGTIDKCSQNFILYWNSFHYFPDLWKHCWTKMTKTKFDFANSLSFAFYSRYNQNNKTLRQLTNNVHKNFVLKQQTFHYFPDL
jgi:hypothetical protein